MRAWISRVAAIAALGVVSSCTMLMGADKEYDECHSDEVLCENGCFGCEDNSETPHCGVNDDSLCCPADYPAFCDVAGVGTGCWQAETDCSTLTACGGEWKACFEGASPHCGVLGELFCCDAEFPSFCDVAGDGTGCWGAGTDCSTITLCGGEWHGCSSYFFPQCNAGEFKCCPSTAPC
jgi:hypothetical protein